MSRRVPGVAVMMVFLLVLAWPAVIASQAPASSPPLVIESMAGKDLFLFYCGSCHGADAKGQGPVARALKSAPADLTGITARSGGTFPRARIIAFVSVGDATVPAHGAPDMPVWGPIFRGLDPSESRTRVRIENLVAYIESLQAR